MAYALFIGTNETLNKIFTPEIKNKKQNPNEDNPNHLYIKRCDVQAPNFPNQLDTGSVLSSKRNLKRDLSKTRS